MRGASRGDPGAGWIAAPAGRVRNPALGRPWVAVRAHYGALPSMAGRGVDEGGRKPAGSGAQEGPVHARKLWPQGQKSRLWSAERCAVRDQTDAPRGAPHPSFSEGRKTEGGLPGAGQRMRAISRACIPPRHLTSAPNLADKRHTFSKDHTHGYRRQGQ
jgi:hypothetical protein